VSKLQFHLLLALVACMLLVGCATPAETTAAITAGGGALVGIIEALQPYLPPEQVAKIAAHAQNAQTMMDAVSAGLGAVAEATAQVKAEASHGMTGTEAAEITAIGSGSAVVASRIMSRLKHGAGPKPQAPAA